MNKTPYTDIIELVLALMKSYELDSIYDDAIQNSEDKDDSSGDKAMILFFLPYFKYASGELQIAGSSIDTTRDDEKMAFSTLLTDGEQLMFAKYILIGYLQKETFDILQMKLHLQDGDFKTFAEKNNLEAKLNALNTLKDEISWNVTRSGYHANEKVWG